MFWVWWSLHHIHPVDALRCELSFCCSSMVIKSISAYRRAQHIYIYVFSFATGMQLFVCRLWPREPSTCVRWEEPRCKWTPSAVTGSTHTFRQGGCTCPDLSWQSKLAEHVVWLFDWGREGGREGRDVEIKQTRKEGREWRRERMKHQGFVVWKICTLQMVMVGCSAFGGREGGGMRTIAACLGALVDSLPLRFLHCDVASHRCFHGHTQTGMSRCLWTGTQQLTNRLGGVAQ